MILGTFSLFGCTVTIEEGGDLSNPAPHTPQHNREVWITVTYGNKVWRQKYTNKKATAIITLRDVQREVRKTVKNLISYVRCEYFMPSVLWVESSVEKYVNISIGDIKASTCKLIERIKTDRG